MSVALVLYLPVIHEGYRKLFDDSGADAIFVLSDRFLDALPDRFDYIKRKDRIRALPDHHAALAFSVVIGKSASVKLVDASDLLAIRSLYPRIVMPDEDLSRYVGELYFEGTSVEYRSAFLRWDWNQTVKQIEAASITGHTVSFEDLDRELMGRAYAESERSGDWWRHVGAALVKDGTFLWSARNRHVPHEHAPYAFGDPRSLFKRGIRIDCSTAEHAEAAVIAEAARRGVSTDGAALYVTTFPCPPCAYLIMTAGIRRCFFSEGYSVLRGAEELQRAGVSLIFVDPATVSRE